MVAHYDSFGWRICRLGTHEDDEHAAVLDLLYSSSHRLPRYRYETQVRFVARPPFNWTIFKFS